MSAQQQAPWISTVLKEHPALMISAFYVVASTVGMLFSWDFLRQFGINVFAYAQIGDFLLASLKEPMTWSLVVLAALLVIIDNAVSRRWQKKDRSAWTSWYGSPRYRLINYLVALLMVTIFIDAYARHKARGIYAGEGRIVDVQFVDSDIKRSATLLDTTAQFVFLFDASTKRVSIHPNENIEEISFLAPRK